MYAERFERDRDRVRVEKPHHERFAVVAGDERCADFNFRARDVCGEPAILRAVVDIKFEAGKKFEARNL